MGQRRRRPRPSAWRAGAVELFLSTNAAQLAERGPLGPAWFSGERRGLRLAFTDILTGYPRDPSHLLEHCIGRPGWWGRDW